MSREPSRVEVLRKLEAMAAQLARDMNEVSADIDARQHRCAPNEKPLPRPKLPVPARAATILDGDPNCPDDGCMRLRGLISLRSEVAGLINEVKGQILRRELKAHRGRKKDSRVRELVREALVTLGPQAPPRAILDYVGARHPTDASAVYRYVREISGEN